MRNIEGGRHVLKGEGLTRVYPRSCKNLCLYTKVVQSYSCTAASRLLVQQNDTPLHKGSVVRESGSTPRW